MRWSFTPLNGFQIVLRWLPLLFLLSCATLAQQFPDTGSIVGQVRVASGGYPNSRILISIEARGMTFGSSYTDNEGRYQFSDLPANPYHLVINENEYEPVSITVSVNPINMRTNVVNITITPRRPQAPTDVAKKPAGSNPYLTNLSDYEKSFPKEAVKDYETGLKLDNQGKIAEAIRHYVSALEKAPRFYAARNNLGSDYLGQGKYTQAEQQFSQVLKENQNDAAAYFNLGNLYLLTKRFNQSQQSLEQGLSKQPDSAFGHFMLGSLFGQMGRSESAEQELRKALQLDPTFAKAHLQLVNLYLQQKNTVAARNELQIFIFKFPQDPLTPQAKEVLKKLEGAPR